MYDPVNAWSTATWRAVEVVRREKVNFLPFFPITSFFQSVAACHSGWLFPSGGRVSVWVYAKLGSFCPDARSLRSLCQSHAHSS